MHKNNLSGAGVPFVLVDMMDFQPRCKNPVSLWGVFTVLNTRKRARKRKKLNILHMYVYVLICAMYHINMAIKFIQVIPHNKRKFP